MKAMNLQELLEEQRRKLVAGTEIICVTEEVIISLPMSQLHPKKSFKATSKLLLEHIEYKNIGIVIHLETIFSA